MFDKTENALRAEENEENDISRVPLFEVFSTRTK